MQRKYKFNWDLIGNMEIGRPNLGNTTRVEVYRLMQFAFRDVLEVKYGTEEADALFYVAGKLAGTEFYEEFLSANRLFRNPTEINLLLRRVYDCCRTRFLLPED